MAFGLLDLSIVTDLLIKHFKKCAGTAAQKFDWTGLAPDAARSGNESHVSVYLCRVAPDRFNRNTYPTGGSAQRIPEQPLTLTLDYLVSAFSAKSYVDEQQAMSMVLKCAHEWPIVTDTSLGAELTLTIEPQTLDEIGRMWQAIAAPMRLSALYRVGVVLVTPPARPAQKLVLRPVAFDEPDHNVKAELDAPAPAVVANGGGRAAIHIPGAGFTTHVPAVQLRALPLTVTTTNPPEPGRFRVAGDEDLDLQLPAIAPAGRYRVEIQLTNPDRAFEVWLDLPPRLVVSAIAGVATVLQDGAEFGPGTAVLVDATALTSTTADPPGAGTFFVADADTVRVGIPTATASGRHLIHLQPAATKPWMETWVDVP
jgi:hypothetical protein